MAPSRNNLLILFCFFDVINSQYWQPEVMHYAEANQHYMNQNPFYMSGYQPPQQTYEEDDGKVLSLEFKTTTFSGETVDVFDSCKHKKIGTVTKLCSDDFCPIGTCGEFCNAECELVSGDASCVTDCITFRCDGNPDSPTFISFAGGIGECTLLFETYYGNFEVRGNFQLNFDLTPGDSAKCGGGNFFVTTSFTDICLDCTSTGIDGSPNLMYGNDVKQNDGYFVDVISVYGKNFKYFIDVKLRKRNIYRSSPYLGSYNQPQTYGNGYRQGKSYGNSYRPNSQRGGYGGRW